jgi:hypothetical protein
MENMMRKTGSIAPAVGNLCVVLGKINGNNMPTAGWFSEKDGERAAKLAAQAGLMVVQLSGRAVPKISNIISAGAINRQSRLQLHPIAPELFADLRREYRGTGNPPSGLAAGSAEGSAAPTGDGVPPSTTPPQPPGGSFDFGPSLMAAYRQIDAAGRMFETLQSELGDVLGKIGSSSEFSFLQEAETTDYDHYTGGDGWVLDGWRWTYPARHRRHRAGQLSIILDLGRPGRPAASIGTPCVIVTWSSPAHDWIGAIDTAAGFWPPLRGMTELRARSLFHWTGKSPGNGPSSNLPLREGAWFYVVRLSGLSNFATLRTHVVQPALSLLSDKDPAAAFAKAPDVLRFRQQQNVFVLAG